VVLFMNENDLSAGNRAMTVLRSLPMAHKAAIGAAVVVVALAGFVFLQWISSPSYSVLASDVTAADLGEITAQLETSGISYRIENGGDRVMVPRQDFASAKSVLATAGITTDAAGARDRGYELLDQQGFGVSSNLERINVQRALEGELARSARAMDGVEDAVVHLVMPEASLFGDPEGASASIVLDTVDGFGAAGARAVASLVAGAVENLEVDAITVIDLQGRTLLAPDDGTAIVEASSAASQTREFEKRLEEDITRLLLSAGAGDRSTVMVQATLDFDQVSRRIESYDPESQVPLREQTETEQFVGDSSLAPGGVPGVDGGEVELPDPTTEGSSYVRNDRVTEFGVDNIVTNEIQAAGALIELHVGVVVDDGSLTGAAVPDADTISNLISNAVGIDPARGDSIVVASVPFPAIEDAEPIALPTGAAAAAGSSPLDLIPQVVGALVLILVVAVVLLMLRSANKQAPLLITPELSSGSAGSLVESTSEGEQAALAPAAAEDPRSEVRRLVERQPEEIAGLLRSWLTEA
jgi:flagellar M-ring protein FliF